MQVRIHRDAASAQHRGELGQRLLQALRDFQCIGAVLAAHAHEHVRLALNPGVAEGRLRGVGHLGHIAQPHVCALALRDDDLCNCLRRASPIHAREQNSFVRRLDEACTPNACCGLRRPRRSRRASHPAPPFLSDRPEPGSRDGRRRRRSRGRRPAPASRRGLIVQSTNARRSVGLIERLANPSFSRSIVEEVIGPRTGVFTPAGKPTAASATRSASSWRSRKMSPPSLNVTLIVARPWIDSERIDSMFAPPLRAFSSGWVTSRSTSSGASPGASACTSAAAGRTRGTRRTWRRPAR